MTSVVLGAHGLLSKWGFCDGDEPDHYLEWLDERGLPHPEDWHRILCHLVRTRLVKDLRARGVDIEVYDIETNHNPIRASKVNGVDIDDYADNKGVLPDAVVTVSFEDVYDTQRLFSGIDAVQGALDAS